MREPSARLESTVPVIKKSGAVVSAAFRVMQKPLLWIVLAFVMSAGCVHHLTDTELQMWRLRGRVVAMTEDTLDVRYKSGHVVKIWLDDRTEFYLNRKPDTRQMVHRDTRVTIDVESSIRGNRARRIDVYR
jgi:hypothetical protein